MNTQMNPVDTNLHQTGLAPSFFKDTLQFEWNKQHYRNKFPTLAGIFDLLDIHYGTSRSEFYRLEDLTFGFLSCAESGDFLRWREVKKYEWNKLVLTHNEWITKEFIVEVIRVAQELRNIYTPYGKAPQQIFKVGFSLSNNEESLIDLFLKYPERDLDMPKSLYYKEYFPRQIAKIIEIDPWKNVTARFAVNWIQKPFSASEFAQHVFDLLLSDLKTSGEINISNYVASTVQLEDKVQFKSGLINKGIEEIITMLQHIVLENYALVLNSLCDWEKSRKIGRMWDPDYAVLFELYESIAGAMFTHLKIAWQPNSKSEKTAIAELYRLFQKHGISNPDKSSKPLKASLPRSK